jgi:hypothetical protein
MTLVAFQTNFARLVVDAEFRHAVESGELAFTGELSARERARLAAIAADPGLAITVKLHRGFRLGKLLAFTPLTCALLGEARIVEQIAGFWRRRPPLSFYYAEEAIAFCDDLLDRRGTFDDPFLVEVVGFERAAVELRERDWRDGDEARVVFDHDPDAVLGALAAGRRPGALARQPTLMIGRRVARERIEWRCRKMPAASV